MLVYVVRTPLAVGRVVLKSAEIDTRTCTHMILVLLHLHVCALAAFRLREVENLHNKKTLCGTKPLRTCTPAIQVAAGCTYSMPRPRCRTIVLDRPAPAR